MDIKWFGHAGFSLTDGKTRVLIDPWLDGNPLTETKWDEVEADVIILTHGHFDHMGDTVKIAKRTDATVIAQYEISNELKEEGLKKVIGPNVGGTVEFDGGWVKLVPAIHSSTTNKGTVSIAAGVILNLGGKTIYDLGDTALFSDLGLHKLRYQLDAMIVPIGGFYTMDRIDAVEAVKLVGAPVVIPMHYNTFPLINADVAMFAKDVESQVPDTKVEIMKPDEFLTI